jgi:hypothetical protein
LRCCCRFEKLKFRENKLIHDGEVEFEIKYYKVVGKFPTEINLGRFLTLQKTIV